jgi:peptidoglycan L-alanyl-D-glutamate endopeptidase CwlK
LLKESEMPQFSDKSQAHLAQAHPELARLFNEVIKGFDITILDGQRGRAAQERAYALGNSRAHFGQSAHNWAPAVAVDVVPYPVDWEDTARFKALAVYVKPIAKRMGIPVAWGGDFESIRDLPHWELSPWREWAKHSKLIGSK